MRAASLCGLLAACGGPLGIDEYPCPEQGTSLDYEEFGEPFLREWCNECHDAQAPDRLGAPDSFVFDTREDVLRHRARIFIRAAGPNDSMPPGPDDPSAGERERLAEWLACGAP